MFFITNKFRSRLTALVSLIAILFGQLSFAPTIVRAAMVSLLSTSSFSNGTAVINIGAPTGTICDIAVGSSVAAPDYGWFGGVPCTTVTAKNIPNVAKVYIRVFAGGPGQDFTLAATSQSVTPTSPTPIISPTYKAPTLITPVLGSILSSNSIKFSWTNEGAKSYELWVGSSKNSTKYGIYKGTELSVIINNLPTDGSTVYIRLFARFVGISYSRFYSFKTINSVAPAPAPQIAPAPTPSPTPAPAPTLQPIGSTNLTAVWANDGGDKITRDEHRATANAAAVVNSVWNGNSINVWGAKNEVVAFNTILEAGASGANNVSVSFDTLTGPNGAVIKSAPATGNGVFDWTNRDIELFYVRYLQIKGLSNMSYEHYDERHIPTRLRRPFTGEGYGTGGWLDRPDHDKFYPDIAVPLELKSTFSIAPNENQSIWADIYIPKTATAGLYQGTLTVKENGTMTRQIPVSMTVRNFTLPEMPTTKTMVDITDSDINKRITGMAWPNTGTTQDAMARLARDRYFAMAHRHKISLIDGDGSGDSPSAEWLPRLNGSLFTSANGYRGPGEGVGNNIYSIGTYGSWNWQSGGESAMRLHSDNWVKWFEANAPATDYFLYLIDESNNYAQTQQWASWIKNNPGPGSRLKSFATASLPDVVSSVPSLDIAASWFTVGNTATWQNAIASWTNQGKQFYLYNGKRPSNGSFAIEDDGVALRELAWAQYKKGVSRWFFWDGTYYNDYQNGRGETNVFQTAQTFGPASSFNNILGQTSGNYANGDGVLFYPGTDAVYPSESYGVTGPIASIRLKEWRRGIEDVDYIALAAKINPAKVQQIVAQMVPKAFWDYGIADPNDPTWVRSDISWSTNPDVWENARLQLANIIEGK